jgi:capsular polysaccharide biosynthesis protein
MSETLELRDLRTALRRQWWIPAALALGGLVVGMVAATNVSPVYRAKGTLLVGPVNSTVIRSTTLRASESLAAFYADLARRQVVLDPVTKTLNLATPWDRLRNSVSAVTPDQNPRLITVTVLGGSRTQVRQTADQILVQLVSLSPTPTAGTEQQFVSGQTAQLKATIEQAERQVQRLNVRLTQARDPQLLLDLRRQLTDNEKLLNDWRHTYVELMAIDLGTDAGGLQRIDDVTTARSSNTAGMIGQGLLGGVLGAALGVVVTWLLHRRRRVAAPPKVPAGRAQPDEAQVSKVEPVQVPATTVPRKAPPGWAGRDQAPAVSPTQLTLGMHTTAAAATPARS